MDPVKQIKVAILRNRKLFNMECSKIEKNGVVNAGSY